MADSFTPFDAACMEQALDLARNGEGRVSPNPPVGCVLVRDGAVVGRGWHNRLGDLHAEAMALGDAGGRARGATCYVTLSPCTTHGRQPPCADALIRAGVAEVVAAVDDPNPRNASGLEVVRRAGLGTRAGLLRDQAEYLARGFFKWMRHGLPYVTFKYAMTLDGKIAAACGDSRWISGPASRELVQDLRSRHDAVMVGSGTALADDPLLTLREPVWSRRGGSGEHPQPVRIVVDSRASLPVDAAMIRDPVGGKLFLATATLAPPEKVKHLEDRGVEVLRFDPMAGRVPLRALMERLGAQGIRMILCEGGAGLAAGLMAADLIDEIVTFVGPKIIGGMDAPGPVADLGLERLADARLATITEVRRVGADVALWAKMTKPGD